MCLAQTATEYESPDVNHVAGMLKCNCGCNLRMDCVMPPRDLPGVQGRQDPHREHAEGRQVRQQILDHFVAENGAECSGGLARPVRAMRLPMSRSALGLGVVFLAIRRYRHVRPAPVVPAGDDAALSRYHDQIEKDLAKLE